MKKINNKHGHSKHGDQSTQRAGLSSIVHEFLEINSFVYFYIYIIDT